ncbi:MAG: hypothetical protein ACD_5C00119G0004 [uncultured bacterium]|nr:MAG: hypothetical protein ACD_5C00119G0004 [uncultured bacterium]
MDKEKMKKEIVKMLDRMQEGSDDMKETFDDAMEDAKIKVKEVRRSADKYILENPERSVLMSAGIGAIIGIALAVLMKKKKCRHCRD